MLTERMQEAFNSQVNAELYSSYLYLSMAAHFESIDLPGFANWMRMQTQEELVHAMKFYHFISERGGRVILTAIETPPREWDSPLAVFEHAYQHEQKVTGLIGALVDLAEEQRDHASSSFLQWFVDEQVEEEASAHAVVRRLKLAGESGSGLFMIDRELGQRVFAMPVSGDQAGG